ncbi:hypothetical protein ABFS83_11G052100 [Erythranthe nasuta]
MPPSQIDLDEMFDLDFSMTLLEDPDTELDKQRCDAQAAASARHMVDEMPTVVVVVGGGDHCSVCMEGFGLFDGAGGKQIHCGHVFHDNCIFQWLSIRDSCPLCRARVSGAGAGGVIL